VPLLVVLKFYFVFLSSSPVPFISKSLLCKTGRGSFLQAKLISSVLLVAGVCSSFSEVNFACELLLTSAKRKNRAFVTVFVLCRYFLLEFFIRAVLGKKFIELGYSCPKFRAWLSFPLCFRTQSVKNAKNGGDGQHMK